MLIQTEYFKSPLGMVEITASENALISLKVLDNSDVEETSSQSSFVNQVKILLSEYFQGTRKQFDLPLQPAGSEFQQKVWNELLKIPYGQTVTYTQLAMRLGSPKLIRAVANANAKNPLWVIVPCHRVIGNRGELVGYAGGLWRKQWLLEHEGSRRVLGGMKE